MSLRRLIFLIAAAMLFAACAGDSAEPVAATSPSDASASADAASDDEAMDDEEQVELTQTSSVLDQVMEAGVVRVGVRNDNPPVSFIDDSGDWVGFDLELAAALGEELGVEVELVPVDGTTRISFLESGQVDMSVASMNHTRSRDAAIDFSVTYFWDNQSFLVLSLIHI